MSLSAHFKPSTRHQTLGDAFYDKVRAAEFPQTRIRFRNPAWAERLGLGSLDDAEWVAHFGRFEPLPGSLPQPLALRYHGHQFGTYNPDLGDGRGFLFAQLHDPVDGRLLDLGTKGSGRTPWSRSGDGRLTLNGGIREVLATAMLEAQGVYTSKSFSLIETGEDLERGDEPSPTRSAVLVRLSHSHIRIGSFQRLLYLDAPHDIARLLDYAIETYWPDAWRDTVAERAAAFLACVAGAVARVGAQWMTAGFVHGVLNTDNINITGESFDYGPWRFVPTYDPGLTAAYFDHSSRYAYGRQPSVLAWNVTRLAECLLPLCPQADLETVLDGFAPAFRVGFRNETLRRLGLTAAAEVARDDALIQAFWAFLESSQAPFEQVVFDLYGGSGDSGRRHGSPCASYYETDAFGPLATALQAARPREDLWLDHPYWRRSVPCTMVHDRVESILGAINATDDWGPFDAILAEIKMMAEATNLREPKPDCPR